MPCGCGSSTSCACRIDGTDPLEVTGAGSVEAPYELLLNLSTDPDNILTITPDGELFAEAPGAACYANEAGTPITPDSGTGCITIPRRTGVYDYDGMLITPDVLGNVQLPDVEGIDHTTVQAGAPLAQVASGSSSIAASGSLQSTAFGPLSLTNTSTRTMVVLIITTAFVTASSGPDAALSAGLQYDTGSGSYTDQTGLNVSFPRITGGSQIIDEKQIVGYRRTTLAAAATLTFNARVSIANAASVAATAYDIWGGIDAIGWTQ